MDIKGSRTEKNLREFFSNELHAYANYMYCASTAREKGLEQLADILYETAQNEAEHARHEFQFLGGIEDVRKSLEISIEKEGEESRRSYPEAAMVAEEEGFVEIADFFRRMSKVEETHKKKFSEILDLLDRGEALEGRTVRHSTVDMAQIMLPGQANPAGYVHGGELMKMMDNAAGVAATRHCHSNVVTAMVHDIRFLKPVSVGNLVLIHGRVTFVSRSSMEVLVEVEAEDLATEKKTKALTAYFMMVALDEGGKPVKVPSLLVSTEEEEMLFQSGLQRYSIQKQKKR